MSTPTRPYGADLTHTLPSARTSEEVRAAADLRATDDGITLSELVRRAVLAYVTSSAEPDRATAPAIPVDDLRQAWGAAKRGGMDFEQWLSAYSNRRGWTESTPSI